MLFRQLKYFIAVVECGSFTEAAEQCYISQSAISQQIQALERDLGVTLIERANRSFTLTPAGDYFYWHGKQLMNEIKSLKRETIRIGSDRELHLRIGFLSSYSGQELHLAVAEFSRTYPEVSIDIIGGTHEELYRMLQNGDIDMALNDQRRAFSDEYENFRLSSCTCCIELSSSDPLAIPDRIDISQLQRKTCILVSPVQERKTEENYYQEILGYGSSYLFAENLPEARLMTVGGRGFLPVDQVGTLPVPEPGLVRRPVFRDSEQLRRSYCVFWKKKNSGYYIEEFAGMLRDLLSSEREQS